MIPKGYKHTELGILPEDWEVVRLGDVCKNFGGKSLEKEVVSNGQYKFISIGNYSIDGKYFDNGQRVLLNKNTQDKLLGKDDLVMVLNDKTSNGKIIGSTILIDKDNAYIYNQRSERLVCSKQLQPLFAWFVLNSEKIRKKIFKMSQGGTQIYVNFSSVRNLQIPLPPLAEQEKIAEILSTWDTQIQNYESLITEKQTLKKGLCQTLLTAKTRLKGFSGDWEVVRLGELGKIVGGGTPNTESSKYWTQQGGIVWLTPTEIKTKYITESRRQITEKGLEESSAKKLPKNTLLITTRATIGDIGIAKVECTTNQGFQSLVCSDSLNYEYAYYALQAYQTKKYFTRFACGSTFLELSSKEVKKTKIPLPPLAEQEKIAEILSEADNEITLLEQKLESLKSQKKGLIQKLLGGKIRINFKG